MCEPVRNSQKFDDRHTRLCGLPAGHPAHHQGHDNVLQDIIGGNQLVILKNEVDLPVPYFIEPILGHLVDRLPIQIIVPAIRHIHTADDVHQRRFPGSRRAQDSHEFSLLHRKADISQHRHGLFSQPVSLIDPFHLYDSGFHAISVPFFPKLFMIQSPLRESASTPSRRDRIRRSSRSGNRIVRTEGLPKRTVPRGRKALR